MTQQILVLNPERNVTLTAYIQAVGTPFSNIPKRPAVLILPGGGYRYCSDREADPVAFAYLKAGFQAFILRYSVKEHAVWPNPLEDYELAMELIRSRSDEWGVYSDRIAVIGFSAGGHLASAAATMSRNRPDAAILGYAVTGEDVKACNSAAPDTVAAVDGKTCPCFLFATRTDELVPIGNTIAFMNALDQAGVAFESHIYSYGPHGFSTCDSSVHKMTTPISKRVPNWVTDSIGWLKEMLGDFGDDGMSEPVCKPYVNGDHEAALSVDCTIGRLLRHPQARAILPELMEQEKAMGGEVKSLYKITLRGLYGFLKVPEEAIDALDWKLRQIPNE